MADHSSGTATRPSLLLRIRDARDTAAWESFVDIYGRLVYSHCRGRGLQHEDAENVTQEVFAQVSQSIRSFDYQPDLGRFRAWLGTVTRNEVSRYFKKDGRLGHRSEAHVLDQVTARAEDSAWEEEFNARLLAAALERCRLHFEEQTWRTFELVWLENHPAAQVAQELQVPIDRVYMAKSRVLVRLQQEVQELADDSALFRG